MSEEVPATPVAEPSTPTTPASEASPAAAPEQPAQSAETTPAEGVNNYFTNEQLAEMQKMFENSGGYEKTWKRMKDAISNPQAFAQSVTPPEAPQGPSATQNVQTPTPAPEATQNGSQSFRAGSISMEEMAVMQYFDSLAADPKYANIADKIRSGEVLKGLKDFNINPLENGRINDADVRKYFDLYSASQPPKPTSTEPANTAAMADDISNIKEVTTMEEANRIQLDNIRRRAAGQQENGLEEKAKAFIKSYYFEQAKKRR